MTATKPATCTTGEYRLTVQTAMDRPGPCAHAYGSEGCHWPDFGRIGIRSPGRVVEGPPPAASLQVPARRSGAALVDAELVFLGIRHNYEVAVILNRAKPVRAERYQLLRKGVDLPGAIRAVGGRGGEI